MSNELYHHGIKDQKWGVRRWQNKDGSLTPEGYPHYGYNGPRKAASAIATTGRNLAKSYRSSQVNRAYKEAARAAQDKRSAKADYNDAKYDRAEAGRKYSDAVDKYKASARKVDKINTNVYAKFVGYSGRTHRKANERLKRDYESLDMAEKEYEAAKIEFQDRKLTYKYYKDIAKHKQQVADNKADDFINRYGDDSYEELYARYKKLGYYQSII